MAGRPTRDTPSRVDPRTGRPLPEGIRWRADRQRYQIRVVGPSVEDGAAERSRTFLTLAEAKRELAKMVAGRNPNGSMTLDQWHDKYWPAIESSIRPATARSYGVAWALTLEQISALLDLIPDGVYRRYFAALVYTGMRAGEATALRVGDVDFWRGVIRVSRSLSPGMRGELIEQSPKSHKSREVPLIDALRPFAEAGARGKRGSDLLFDGPDGGRLTNHNARRAVNWEELREAIGRPDLRIHDLRHTFATILFDAGATAPDVQATLGHSSLQVTERYSRAREGVALRAGAVLNDALKRADESADASKAKTGAQSQAKPAHPEPEMAQRRTRRTLNGTLMAQPHERPRGISR